MNEKFWTWEEKKGRCAIFDDLSRAKFHYSKNVPSHRPDSRHIIGMITSSKEGASLRSMVRF